MSSWYVTLAHFGTHCLGLVLAYYLGTQSLNRRLKSQTIVLHQDINDPNEPSRVPFTFQSEDEKYPENTDNQNSSAPLTLPQIIEAQQRRSNSIDSDLQSAFTLTQSDRFRASQSRFPWTLWICILCILCSSTTIGILYQWTVTLMDHNWNFSVLSNDQSDDQSVQITVYCTFLLWILFRIWTAITLYQYTRSVPRCLLNLIFEYEPIHCLFVAVKLNKLWSSTVISPLSHFHVMMSTVFSFWTLLSLSVFMAYGPSSESIDFVLCILTILCHSISVLTAFIMDDGQRLRIGLELQCVGSWRSSKEPLSVSPSFIFRALFRCIDVILRALVLYAVIATMGMSAFWTVMAMEIGFVILNAVIWSEFHYALDLVHCLVVSSLTLIHRGTIKVHSPSLSLCEMRCQVP